MRAALLALLVGALLTGCGDESTARYNAAMRQLAAGQGEAALSAIQELAEQGYPKAQRHIGLFRLAGMGMPRDPTVAADWFAKAAAQDDPGGLYFLAEMTWQGRGRPENREEALALMERVAELRVIPAMWRAGEWAETLDAPQKALNWYTQAAEFGHPKAMQRLVLVYTKGELGQAADASVAQRWQAAQRRKAF